MLLAQKSALIRVATLGTIAVLAGALALPALAGDSVPVMNASFSWSDVDAGDITTSVTMTITLASAEPKDLNVSKIVLSDPTKIDSPFATFSGGTLSAGGQITRTATAQVPVAMFKSWKAGGTAELFVTTINGSGDRVRTRISAGPATPQPGS